MSNWQQSACVFFASLAGLLLYNYRSQWLLIKSSAFSYSLFTVRLLLLVMAFHLLFQASSVKPLWGYIVVLSIAFVSLCHIGSFGLVSIAVGYIFYEWIFWFPDKHQWINSDALSPGNSSSNYQHLINASGITLTPLRPSGRVRVCDSDVEAFSSDGFIDANEMVRIIAEKPFGVVVEKEKNRTYAARVPS